ncbi:hypothetical protein [Prolixibacter denitrificans]|uniref:Lipoprotein n=1 Tax=Prolixibacter denitrificans TaxID=1541063 RepID=A0A2P8CFP7_9BACT|nr:hypothetical protein [Prolixibacter denitrificans]PSK83752.1 hypothetical protein CLV93_103167 [Prolixibacter denitrificans]GET23296.1 hypothetical protein JCM18694_35420 [Prolixibacter denitrificans]
MRKLIILLIASLLFSCSSKKENNKGNSTKTIKSENIKIKKHITNKKFAALLDKLDTLSLPYKNGCFGEYKGNNILDTSEYSFLVRNVWECPYRKIPTKNNFEIIMYLVPADVLLPVIRTYDLNGKEIDSEQMFFGYCGGEPSYYHTEHFEIDKRLNIHHIDSTWTCEVDSLYNDIDSTRVLKVKTYQWKIQEDGQIVKEKNNAP